MKENWQIGDSHEGFADPSVTAVDHTLLSSVELKWVMARGGSALGLIKKAFFPFLPLD